MYEEINAGKVVLCDYCNADAESLEGEDSLGGGLVHSSALCPACYTEAVKRCKQEYPEEMKYFSPFPADKTFYQNVLDYRKEHYGNDDLVITFTSW